MVLHNLYIYNSGDVLLFEKEFGQKNIIVGSYKTVKYVEPKSKLSLVIVCDLRDRTKQLEEYAFGYLQVVDKLSVNYEASKLFVQEIVEEKKQISQIFEELNTDIRLKKTLGKLYDLDAGLNSYKFYVNLIGKIRNCSLGSLRNFLEKNLYDEVISRAFKKDFEKAQETKDIRTEFEEALKELNRNLRKISSKL